jgi:hypothetical protein
MGDDAAISVATEARTLALLPKIVELYAANPLCRAKFIDGVGSLKGGSSQVKHGTPPRFARLRVVVFQLIQNGLVEDHSLSVCVFAQ